MKQAKDSAHSGWLKSRFPTSEAWKTYCSPGVSGVGEGGAREIAFLVHFQVRLLLLLLLQRPHLEDHYAPSVMLKPASP